MADLQSYDDDARRLRRVLWILAGLLIGFVGLRIGISSAKSETNIFGEWVGFLWSHTPGKVIFIALGIWVALRLLVFRPGTDRGRDNLPLQIGFTLVALTGYHFFISDVVPFQISQIGSSYLIFFYHFPSALNCLFFFTLLFFTSIAYLRTEDPLWDRASRVAAQVGVVACLAALVTGSAWAKSAWGHWWVWEDPRLITTAIMCLTYVGYVMLQSAIDDDYKRRRYCAVLGIIAFLNLPLVNKAPEWFGQVKHPVQFEDLKSDPTIQATRWLGTLVFLSVYTLIFRWRFERESVHDRASQTIDRVRRLEEGWSAS